MGPFSPELDLIITGRLLTSHFWRGFSNISHKEALNRKNGRLEAGINIEC